MGLVGLPVCGVRSRQTMKGGRAVESLDPLDPAMPEATPLSGLTRYVSKFPIVCLFHLL